MNSPLVLKELRELAVPLIGDFLMALAGYFLIAILVLFGEEAGNWLDVLRLFVISMAVLASIALGELLVVKEYRARTQLFLEGLPVSRWRMAATKYGVGFLVLLLRSGRGQLGIEE